MRIMAAMDEHKHPQQDMIESFETGAMPPPSSPAMVRPAPLPPAPPRICEVGPCRSYHRLEFMLDAQNPLDGSDGRIHLKVMHSCYTQIGVDTDITDVPVFACNRWDPFSSDEADDDGPTRRRVKVSATVAGQRFTAQLQAWRDEVARREAENPIESDAHADDPLLSRMHELHGSKDLPEHTPGPDGPCTDDCPRCALGKAAVDSMLDGEGDDGVTDIMHAITTTTHGRTIRSTGRRVRDGQIVVVGSQALPDHLAHLNDGTVLTIEDGRFTTKTA